MWRIMFLVIIGLTGGCAPGQEGRAMALDIKLTIEKSEFLFQESPPCLLTVTNDGRDTIRILNPAVSKTMPILRVVDARSGEETMFQKKSEGFVPEEPQPLAPGHRMERGFWLLDEVNFPSPGPYRISAIYQYEEGAKRVESAPVKVNILPATPKNAFLLHNGPGGSGSVLYGAWVNLASDPPQIVRTQFDAMAGGGVRASHSIAKTDLESRPVLSAPPNRSVAKSHWVGWLEENYLRFAHFDEAMGASPVGKFELPKLELEIVAPLHSDPVTDTRVRPAGAALVWMGDADGTRSGLQVIELSANKATTGGSVNLPGARPRWIASFERSNGERVALFTQVAKDRVGLFSVPWPDKERGGTSPQKLVEWKGKFVAAGATIDAGDAILGAVLIWSGEGAEQKLELVNWSLDRQGKFSERRRQKLEWDYAQKIDSAIVRVNAKGMPVAVLRDGEGKWSAFTGEGKPAPLPGAYAQTKLPFDIAFMGGIEPVLIGGRVQLGFEMLKLDGSPLPAKRR